MRPYLWFVLLAGLPGAAGCSGPREKTAGSLPTPAEPVTYTENGWSADQRREFYHLPEGSELMPYVLLSNVVSVKTGKPFLEDMERFGFVPDARSATNPHGLPVGITTVHSRDKSLTGLEMTGFNCAACHVGEIAYHGTHLRIDGAPSLINLQAYQVEFRDSLDATLRDPKKLLQLALAIDRQEDAADTPSEAGASGYASDPSVQKGDDVAVTPTADASFHSVSSAAADAASSRGVLNKPSFRERLRTDVALLKARLSYLKNGKLLVDGTEPGPGRVDAFGAARNLLFPANALKMQSPVSFPFIWDVPDTTQQRSAADMKWIHYDGNTNSILERNIGQALGMGAVFDPATYESTLRIANLHRLEVLTHELKAPAWPAGLLGPIDQAKAKAGEQIFNAKCRDCHQGRLYNLLEVGTDPQRANSFGQPVQGRVPFPKAIQPILDGLKARAFADDGIPPAEQAGMDASPVVWRATGQYMARP
ncbi:MAG TPA: di-heme-cytochrome C peroxidase, partial [Bryobacteraceae bacterium]|nr:di-heme-cytochrome C peroxidase [Bryobacteraceae bacterium]